MAGVFVMNFQARFAAAVAQGGKRQTIRALRKDGKRPRVGQTLRCYTGMRSKGCRLLREAVCSRVAVVVLDGQTLTVDGAVLAQADSAAFARRDGFESVADFLAFFRATHGLPFCGWLIEW